MAQKVLLVNGFNGRIQIKEPAFSPGNPGPEVHELRYTISQLTGRRGRLRWYRAIRNKLLHFRVQLAVSDETISWAGYPIDDTVLSPTDSPRVSNDIDSQKVRVTETCDVMATNYRILGPKVPVNPTRVIKK
jgi:hypothetical protein